MKRLTTKERDRIQGCLSGRYNPNSQASRSILDKPHVAVTMEAILDRADLTDDKIALKIKAVMNRKAEAKMDKIGNVTTNQTIVDNNALQAARMLWQVKGKFVEKHEVSRPLEELSDRELDSLIDSNTAFLAGGGKIGLN